MIDIKAVWRTPSRVAPTASATRRSARPVRRKYALRERV